MDSGVADVDRRRVRWSDLFLDLEAQFAAGEAAALAAEVSDRTRRELALIRLVDRLRAAVGSEVTARVASLGGVTGRLEAVGPDWLLLVDGAGRENLLPAAHVVAVNGVGPDADTPDSEGVLAARLDLRYVLRGLARSRSPVGVSLVDGQTVTGTIDRVGADFVELARHEGEARRRTAVSGSVVLPLAGVVAVRSL